MRNGILIRERPELKAKICLRVIQTGAWGAESPALGNFCDFLDKIAI